MTKYHINNAGDPGPCKAVFNCPFGDLELEHYNSKEEAAEAFEKRQEAIGVASIAKIKRKMGAPILREPSKMTIQGVNPSYYVEYDYDSYECSDPERCAEEMICRDKVYEGLRITGWTRPDALADYTRSRLGLGANEEFPSELKERLAPLSQNVLNDFEIHGTGGYYGEEVEVTAPDYLDREINDYYWSQPNAVDQNKILPYLRGKGFETQGLSPLKAIKEQLKTENKGKELASVSKSTSYKLSSISLKKISKGSVSQEKAAAKDPREPAPIAGSGAKNPIAGVVVMDKNGDYNLVDGYHRTAFLDAQNKSGRKQGTFIVLNGGNPTGWRDYSWTRD